MCRKDLALQQRVEKARECVIMNTFPEGPMTVPASSSINMPKQDRSRASFERVLEGAVELLEERGYEGFTLQEVSRRSRTSVGSIYCRVKSKDELFHAVHQYVLDQLDMEMNSILDPAKWEGVEPHKLIYFLVRELAEYLRRHTPILRAFISREQADAAVMKRGKKAHFKVAEKFEWLLCQHAAEFNHPDPKHAAAFCFNLTYASIAKHLDLDTITPALDGAKWNQLIDDLGRTVALFLLSREPVSNFFPLRPSVIQKNITRKTLPKKAMVKKPKCAVKTLRG
jgi:AcrR family transcriptional regulator